MSPVAAAPPSYDMVMLIMAHVRDVVTLFRCATACKGWRDLLVSNPAFLRRCMPEYACRSAPLPGFFAQLRPRRGSPTPCLVPPPRPVLGSYRRPLRSFIPNLDDPGFFDHAVPLVSRHGLLLVRIGFFRTVDDPDETGDNLLVVCNLLSGKLDVLPPLQNDFAVQDPNMTGYAIVTGADCSSSNDDSQNWLPFFKVLVIGINCSLMQYRLRTFSSLGEPRWNMSIGIVEGHRVHTKFLQHNAVVCRGMAHWLFEGMSSFYTVDVSAMSGDVFFTKLAITLHHGFIDGLYFKESYFAVDRDGRLGLICLQKREGLKIKIWTWEDDGSSPEARILVLKQPYKRKKNEIGCVMYTLFGENSGTLLIKDNHRRVYVADVETGVMHEVTRDWPCKCDLRRSKTASLDMDWPTLVLSRLGATT